MSIVPDSFQCRATGIADKRDRRFVANISPQKVGLLEVRVRVGCGTVYGAPYGLKPLRPETL